MPIHTDYQHDGDCRTAQPNVALRPNVALLRERAALLRELRKFFDDRGFLEVQPPCLSRGCIVDPFIDPIEVPASQMGLSMEGSSSSYYLQTSPELAMKRMLAAGAPSIYSIGPVFRGGELGDHHNPEFTMLEWYEVGANLASEIELLGSLAAQMLHRDGYTVTTYRQLFVDALGFDPIEVDLGVLRQNVAAVDESLADSIGPDRDRLLDVLLSERIQPSLGVDRPTIIKNYPLSQAALARVSDEDPECAARFELLADGVEIANGYDELRDCDVLADRFRRANEMRVQAGRKPLGGHDQELVRAISERLPACAGVALGVDRLLMVRCRRKTIGEVMPLTWDLA